MNDQLTMKLELVQVPVTDIDRAKAFLEQGHAVSVKNGDMQVTKKLEAIRQTLA